MILITQPRRGVIINLHMGAGKTVVALHVASLLFRFDLSVNRHSEVYGLSFLICVPARAIPVWVKECERTGLIRNVHLFVVDHDLDHTAKQRVYDFLHRSRKRDTITIVLISHHMCFSGRIAQTSSGRNRTDRDEETSWVHPSEHLRNEENKDGPKNVGRERRLPLVLEDYPFRAIIVDEASEITGKSSDTTKALFDALESAAARGHVVVGLSGTGFFKFNLYEMARYARILLPTVVSHEALLNPLEHGTEEQWWKLARVLFISHLDSKQVDFDLHRVICLIPMSRAHAEQLRGRKPSDTPTRKEQQNVVRLPPTRRTMHRTKRSLRSHAPTKATTAEETTSTTCDKRLERLERAASSRKLSRFFSQSDEGYKLSLLDELTTRSELLRGRRSKIENAFRRAIGSLAADAARNNKKEDLAALREACCETNVFVHSEHMEWGSKEIAQRKRLFLVSSALHDEEEKAEAASKRQTILLDYAVQYILENNVDNVVADIVKRTTKFEWIRTFVCQLWSRLSDDGSTSIRATTSSADRIVIYCADIHALQYLTDMLRIAWKERGGCGDTVSLVTGSNGSNSTYQATTPMSTSVPEQTACIDAFRSDCTKTVLLVSSVVETAISLTMVATMIVYAPLDNMMDQRQLEDRVWRHGQQHQPRVIVLHSVPAVRKSSAQRTADDVAVENQEKSVEKTRRIASFVGQQFENMLLPHSSLKGTEKKVENAFHRPQQQKWSAKGCLDELESSQDWITQPALYRTRRSEGNESTANGSSYMYMRHEVLSFGEEKDDEEEEE